MQSHDIVDVFERTTELFYERSGRWIGLLVRSTASMAMVFSQKDNNVVLLERQYM